MHLFFDLAIYGFLLVDGLFIGLVLYWIAKGRLRWRPLVLLLLLVFSWLVIFYGSFIESRLLVIHEKTIRLNDESTAKLRVALISDFHLGPYKKTAWVKKVVDKVQTLSPDLVFLAGDYILGEAYPEYLTPLANLRAPHGIYAVLGNHDYTEDEFYKLANYVYEGNERVQGVVKALTEAGIRVLRNTSVEIVLENDKKFFLGGVDDYWTERADAEKTFKNVIPGLTGDLRDPRFRGDDKIKILLTHNPDVIHDAEKNGVDLVLAGHTHGGQIRLPFLGSVPPIPDKLGRKYDRGLFRFGDTQLFITSGLGETGPRARLLVPPEITLLTIEL